MNSTQPRNVLDGKRAKIRIQAKLKSKMVASVDEDERPSWLLKQVRDLTENWEIPLGDELEKYLDQV